MQSPNPNEKCFMITLKLFNQEKLAYDFINSSDIASAIEKAHADFNTKYEVISVVLMPEKVKGKYIHN